MKQPSQQQQQPISCPDTLVIPYTATYSTFHRILSIRNASSGPVRLLVQLTDTVVSGDSDASSGAGVASLDKSSSRHSAALTAARPSSSQRSTLSRTSRPSKSKNPFSISYANRKLFSGEELQVKVEYTSGRDMTRVQETQLRILSANQVRIVTLKAVPLSTMRAAGSTQDTSGKRRLSSRDATSGAAAASVKASRRAPSTNISFQNVPLNDIKTKSIDLRNYMPASIPDHAQWKIKFQEPVDRGVWSFHPKNSSQQKHGRSSYKIKIQYSPVQMRTSHQDIIIFFQYKDASGSFIKESARLSLVGTPVDDTLQKRPAATLLSKSAASTVAGGMGTSKRRPSLSTRAEDTLKSSSARSTRSRKRRSSVVDSTSQQQQEGTLGPSTVSDGIDSVHKLHTQLEKEKKLSQHTLGYRKYQIEIQQRLTSELDTTGGGDTQRRTKSKQSPTDGLMESTQNEDVSPESSLLDKKQKEAQLMKKASEFHEHEKMKEIKWFKEVGSQPPTKEEQETIKKQRQEQRELMARRERQLNRERKVNDTTVGKPIVQQTVKQTFIDESIERSKRPPVEQTPQPDEEAATEPPPAKEEKQSKKKPASKKGGRASKEVSPPAEPTTTPLEEAEQKGAPTQMDEQHLLAKQLTSEFVQFSNVVLLRERVRRRLQFISERTEDQNIQLALKEGNIPRLEAKNIKIRTLPVPPISDASASSQQSQEQKIAPMPEFKDFSFINLKVPLEYKIKNYSVEHLEPLNTFMPPEEVLDYQSAFNVPFPVEQEYDLLASSEDNAQQSEEQNHKTLLRLMDEFTELFASNGSHIETAQYTDKRHFDSLVPFKQRLPSSTDSWYEVLSTNKQVIREAYQRITQASEGDNKDSDNDDGNSLADSSTSKAMRRSPQDHVVFTTFSSQFDAQEEDIVEPEALHPVVKKCNLPLEEYAAHWQALQDENLPAMPQLRPFKLSDEVASDVNTESTDENDAEEDASVTKSPESAATHYHNLASILVNYSLSSQLYPSLKDHIPSPEPDQDTEAKNTAKKPAKKANSKKKTEACDAEDFASVQDVHVQLSNAEMRELMMSQMTNSIQRHRVTLLGNE